MQTIVLILETIVQRKDACKITQNANEVCSMQLKHKSVAWTSGAEKLHSLSEPPRILLHHIRRKYLQPEQDMF